MPGPWVHFQENPDFFESFEIAQGAYYETTVYDHHLREQGKGLWKIARPEPRGHDGVWSEATLIAVSDSELHGRISDEQGNALYRQLGWRGFVKPIYEGRQWQLPNLLRHMPGHMGSTVSESSAYQPELAGSDIRRLKGRSSSGERRKGVPEDDRDKLQPGTQPMSKCDLMGHWHQ
eukprot:s1077_g18.t1